MRFARTLTAVLLPLALLGACGDDDDDPALEVDEATTTTADGSEDGDGDEGSGTDRAADQALADSIVLTLADVGPDWEVSTDDEDDDEDEEETDLALAECLQVDPAVMDDEGEAMADALFDREQGRIEGSVSITETVEEAVSDFEILKGDRFADCYGGLLDDELRSEAESDPEAAEAGVTYGGVEMTRIDVPAGLGEEAIGYRATIAISAQGVDFSSYADFVFVRRGRVEMTTSLLSNFEPPPAAYAVSLASAMDRRAASA